MQPLRALSSEIAGNTAADSAISDPLPSLLVALAVSSNSLSSSISIRWSSSNSLDRHSSQSPSSWPSLPVHCQRYFLGYETLSFPPLFVPSPSSSAFVPFLPQVSPTPAPILPIIQLLFAPKWAASGADCCDCHRRRMGAGRACPCG